MVVEVTVFPNRAVEIRGETAGTVSYEIGPSLDWTTGTATTDLEEDPTKAARNSNPSKRRKSATSKRDLQNPQNTGRRKDT